MSSIRSLSLCLEPYPHDVRRARWKNIVALFADNSIEDRYPRGLEANLGSMIALTRSIDVEPVVFSFTIQADHPKSNFR